MPDTTAVDALKKACDDAYVNNPSSCSNAVWDVIRAIINPNETYRVANVLVDHMEGNWKKVSLDDGYTLANEGTVVVGGLKATGNGHVIVIYPGTKVMKKGVALPRCLSTSKSDWPGTRSKGDKSVADPWSPADFAKVKFYTPIDLSKLPS